MSSVTENLESSVAAACHLLAQNADVHAVHVVTGYRPGYKDLVRFRALAQSYGVDLTVSAGGGIVLHSRLEGTADEPAYR